MSTEAFLRQRSPAPLCAEGIVANVFNSITGRITEKRENALFLETNGLEWDIAVPSSSLAALPVVGESARVFTYLYHREDQMRLFGFATSAERSVFFDLLKVDGVGPKQALKVLSGLPFDLLLRSLDSGDVEALSRMPGLGTKTAQKIVLALRGKLSFRSEGESSEFEDIVAALVEMGFDRRQASDAVQASVAEIGATANPAPEIEKELLRLSIMRLSQSR